MAVDTWRKKLASATLPMLSSTPALEELLSASIDLGRMARLLDRDPPLALDIVLAAGRLPNAPDAVQSLQHALNLMGVDRAQRFIHGRKARRLNPQNYAHRMFLQAVSVGRFAASLVARWEEKHAPGSSGYLACLTLLLGLARWKLPLGDPQVARTIEARAWAGERRSVVEAELLGCSMAELNRAILIDSGFPPDAPLLDSFVPDNAMLLAAADCAWTKQIACEVPAPIGRWLRQPTMPALLAHLLAWAAQDAWYANRTLLYLKVVSARENKPLDFIIADTHRTAVFAARSLGDLAGLVLTPAEQLFFPRQKTRSLRSKPKNDTSPEAATGRPAPKSPPARDESSPTAPKRQAPPAPPPPTKDKNRPQPPAQAVAQGAPQPPTQKPTQTPKPAPAQKPDAKLVQEFVRSCRENKFRDVRELMQKTGEVLDKGMDLKRSMIFLVHAKKGQLSCDMRHGYDSEQHSVPISMPTSETNLLTRLLEQAGSIHVTTERVVSARTQLPSEMADLVCSSGFGVTAIRLNGKAVGLILADTGVETSELHPRQYEALRIVSANFSTALTGIMKTPRK